MRPDGRPNRNMARGGSWAAERSRELAAAHGHLGDTLLRQGPW